MKTERRHELQHNTLADALGNVVEGVKPYQQIILGCILAGVVVFGVVRYLSMRSTSDQAEGWNSYLRATANQDLDALSDLAERSAGTPAGNWALLYLGDQRLEEGIEQLFVNKSEARDQLKKAEESYLAVREKSSEPLLKQRATLGLARVHESLVDLEKARDEYQRLVDQWPDSVYAAVATRRLEDLKEKSTREFYDWFAAQEPKPPVEGPGTPGMRPPFNLDDIPDSLPNTLTPGVSPGSSDIDSPATDSPGTDKPAETPAPTTPSETSEGDAAATPDNGEKKPATSESDKDASDDSSP